MSGASDNVLLIPEETLADFRTIVDEWGTFRQVKAYQGDELEEVLENSSANSTLVLDMRLWRRGRDEWGKVLQRVKEKRLFPILTAMDLVWTEIIPMELDNLHYLLRTLRDFALATLSKTRCSSGI